MSLSAWIMAHGVYPYRKRAVPPLPNLVRTLREPRAVNEPSPDPIVFGSWPADTRSPEGES